MRRVIMGVAALAMMAVPVGVATITLAPAATAGGASITCAKLSGTSSGPITIKKCSFKDKQNKSLGGSALKLATGGTLTWSPSGQTTIVAQPTITPLGQGSCKPKNTEYLTTGSVTGGTSTHTKAGDTFHSYTCVNNTSGKLTLLKGTTLEL